MKRFRIRPQRMPEGHIVWLGGADCGRFGVIKAMTIKRDCGAAVDFLLNRKPRRKPENVTYHMGRPTRPSYPEH